MLALLLAFVAGLLLIFNHLYLPREITLEWIFGVAIAIILGVILIVAGLIVYERRYWEGGVLAIVVGIIVLIRWDIFSGILAILGGLLALVAERP